MPKRENNTQLNHYMRVKTAVDDCYSRVINQKLSFDEYLALRKLIIFENYSYSKLTRVNAANISGYGEGKYNIITRYMHEWRLFDKDGNLVLTHATEIDYKFDYSVCRQREEKGLPIGHHVWKDTNGFKIWA